MTAPSKCSATVFGGRVQSWQCQRGACVQREGRWYCRQHDPVEIKVRQVRSSQKLRAIEREDDAIAAEAEAIAKRLGVGRPFYEVTYRGRSGYRRALILTFEEAETLLKQIKV